MTKHLGILINQQPRETLIPFKLRLPQKRLQQDLVFVRGMLLKPVLTVTFFFTFGITRFIVA